MSKVIKAATKVDLGNDKFKINYKLGSYVESIWGIEKVKINSVNEKLTVILIIQTNWIAKI